VQYNMHSFV